MLKTLGSTEFKTQPGEGGVEFGGSSRVRHDENELDGSRIDGGEIGDNKVGKKFKICPCPKRW